MPPGGSARHRLCPVYVFRATGSMPGSMPPVLFFSSVSYSRLILAHKVPSFMFLARPSYVYTASLPS